MVAVVALRTSLAWRRGNIARREQGCPGVARPRLTGASRARAVVKKYEHSGNVV